MLGCVSCDTTATSTGTGTSTDPWVLSSVKRGFSTTQELGGRREGQKSGQRGESVWKGSTHFCRVTHQPLAKKKKKKIPAKFFQGGKQGHTVRRDPVYLRQDVFAEPVLEAGIC